MSGALFLQLVCFVGCLQSDPVFAGHVMTVMANTRAASVLQNITVRSLLECAASCRLAENCVMVSMANDVTTSSSQACVQSDYSLQVTTDINWTSYKIPTGSTHCMVTDESLMWSSLTVTTQPASQLSTIRTQCTVNAYSFGFTKSHYYVPCYTERKILVIDRNTNTVVNVHPTVGRPWDSVTPPGADYVLITDSTENKVMKVTPTSMTTFRDMSVDGADKTRGLAYQNGQVLVGAHNTNDVYFLDPVTQDLLGFMPTLPQPHFICVCRSGRFMITFQNTNQITKYDCDRSVMWTITFSKPRGCLCDHGDNFLVVRRSLPEIYLVTSDRSSVTLYHDARDVTDYKQTTHGPIHNIYVEDNKLYYILEEGYVFVHSLQ